MQFTGAVADLKEAVDKANKVACAHSTEPIYRNVRLVGKRAYLTVEATDLRLAMQATVVGEGDTPGEVLIPAKALQKILTGLEKRDPKGQVSLSMDENRHVTISMGQVKHTIPSTDDPKNFPVLSGLCLEAPPVSISTTDLRDTVERLDFKSGEVTFEDTRIEIHAKSKSLRFISTDSVQMAYNDVSYKGTDMGPVEDIIVPTALLTRLAHLLDPKAEALLRCDKEVGVLTANSLLGSLAVSVRLSDKTFPNYKQIMPRDPAATARFVAADLIQAMEDCAVIADENKGRVDLTFPGGADSMGCIVSSEAMENGRAESAVRLQGLKVRDRTGADWKSIRLNRKYLGRYLGTLKRAAKEVNVGLTSPIYPMLFTVDEVPGYVYVLMPINR